MQLWRRGFVGSLRYEAYWADASEVPELKTEEGWTVYADGRIYINDGLKKNPSRALDALVHELLHAQFEATGIGAWVRTRA